MATLGPWGDLSPLFPHVPICYSSVQPLVSCQQPFPPPFCINDGGCRWSGEAETVALDRLPHRRLTRPAKVFEFDFCQQLPAGSTSNGSLLYPTEAAVALEVVAAGRLNAVVLWFDLHLEAGVALTSGNKDGLQSGSWWSAG